MGNVLVSVEIEEIMISFFFQNFQTLQSLHLRHFQASGPRNSDSTRHSGSNELGIIKIEAMSVKIEDFKKNILFGPFMLTVGRVQN